MGVEASEQAASCPVVTDEDCELAVCRRVLNPAGRSLDDKYLYVVRVLEGDGAGKMVPGKAVVALSRRQAMTLSKQLEWATVPPTRDDPVSEL